LRCAVLLSLYQPGRDGDRPPPLTGRDFHYPGPAQVGGRRVRSLPPRPGSVWQAWDGSGRMTAGHWRASGGMASAPAAAPSAALADLLERLGRVPPERIRLRPAPGMATEADLLVALHQPGKRICELVEGTLVEKPMGYRESLLAAYLIRVLGAFVD